MISFKETPRGGGWLMRHEHETIDSILLVSCRTIDTDALTGSVQPDTRVTTADQ